MSGNKKHPHPHPRMRNMLSSSNGSSCTSQYLNGGQNQTAVSNSVCDLEESPLPIRKAPVPSPRNLSSLSHKPPVPLKPRKNSAETAPESATDSKLCCREPATGCCSVCDECDLSRNKHLERQPLNKQQERSQSHWPNRQQRKSIVVIPRKMTGCQTVTNKATGNTEDDKHSQELCTTAPASSMLNNTDHNSGSPSSTELIQNFNCKTPKLLNETLNRQIPVVKAGEEVDENIYYEDVPINEEEQNNKDSELSSTRSSSKRVGQQPWKYEHCSHHKKKASPICDICYKTSYNPKLLNDTTDSGHLPGYFEEDTTPKVEHLDQLDQLVESHGKYAKGRQPALHEDLVPVLPSAKMGISCDTGNRSSVREENPNYELLGRLKEAGKDNFTAEEFDIAQKKNTRADPDQWLKTVWRSEVQHVLDEVKDRLKWIHPLAEYSQEEARLALIQANGETTVAAQIAFQTWEAMYKELLSNTTISSLPADGEEVSVINALNESKGDIVRASQMLFQSRSVADVLQGIGVNADKPYNLVTHQTVPNQKQQQILVEEFKTDTVDQAMNVPKRSSVNPIKACAICMETFPNNEIQVLNLCQCMLCTDCLKKYFHLVIREKHVVDLVCPNCGKPDVNNSDEFETHLGLLQIMLKHYLTKDDMELLDKKLTEWNLMQDPDFRWCSYNDCGCGFIFIRQHPGELMMECPECRRATCFGCKLPWEKDHVGNTCEQFAFRKSAREPINMKDGPGDFIQSYGIDCPKCHLRYSVSKSGCLHFTCIHCRHEFCSGCHETFNRGKDCTEHLPLCTSFGLHCHHPRSCLYYLRNKPVNILQKLLQDHGISFITNDGSNRCFKSPKCPVLELKETNKDEPCGKDVRRNHAGLCEEHYKEYLVLLINQYDIDPVSIMTNNELKIQFSRVGKNAPEKNRYETSQMYDQRLRELIQQQIPLPSWRQPSMTLPKH